MWGEYPPGRSTPGSRRILSRPSSPPERAAQLVVADPAHGEPRRLRGGRSQPPLLWQSDGSLFICPICVTCLSISLILLNPRGIRKWTGWMGQDLASGWTTRTGCHGWNHRDATPSQRSARCAEDLGIDLMPD
jgi:hypothetical protein